MREKHRQRGSAGRGHLAAVCVAAAWVAGAVGAGAGCSGNASSLTGPIRRGDKLVLQFGSTTFEVDPAKGGRITSLQVGDTELLSAVDASNYGSTFWPSPQAAWNWPPPAAIDNMTYAATIADPSITLTGGIDPVTQVSVTKKFTADVTREAVDIAYTITNHAATAASWAPWEITRVSATGLVFWPSGGAPFKGTQALLDAQDIGGTTWVDASATAGEAKLLADGSGGWLAQVTGRALLLKTFPDQPATAAAPQEAEVEVYVNPTHTYVEMENQGAYQPIPAGGTVTWTVRWYARALPSSADTSMGSADLPAFAQQTAQ